MFRLPQSPTASTIAKSGPLTSSTHKGKLVLPPPLSRSYSIKWLSFHTGIPWTSAIFSTIRRRTTTWWCQMMRTSPTASLRSSAHSRMKTRQATMTTVWNRKKLAPVKLRGIWRIWPYSGCNKRRAITSLVRAWRSRRRLWRRSAWQASSKSLFLTTSAPLK